MATKSTLHILFFLIAQSDITVMHQISDIPCLDLQAYIKAAAEKVQKSYSGSPPRITPASEFEAGTAHWFVVWQCSFLLREHLLR